VNRIAIYIVIRYKLPAKTPADISLSSYRALAEFRHQIRLFVHFSEEAARQAGVEPQQHQLLLAIKGIPIGAQPTIGRIAERLQIRHHSAVELVDRLTEHGAIARETNPDDGREVRLRLTRAGERLLRKLSISHHNELGKAGPALRDALDAVLQLARKKS
jgi:DNA-binding MarR family transcriptional regulator